MGGISGGLQNAAMGQVPGSSPGGFNIDDNARKQIANQALITLGLGLMNQQTTNHPNGNTTLNFGGTLANGLGGALGGINSRVDTAHQQGVSLGELQRRAAEDQLIAPLRAAQTEQALASADYYRTPRAAAAPTSAQALGSANLNTLNILKSASPEVLDSMGLGGGKAQKLIARLIPVVGTPAFNDIYKTGITPDDPVRLSFEVDGAGNIVGLDPFTGARVSNAGPGSITFNDPKMDQVQYQRIFTQNLGVVEEQLASSVEGNTLLYGNSRANPPIPPNPEAYNDLRLKRAMELTNAQVGQSRPAAAPAPVAPQTAPQIDASIIASTRLQVASARASGRTDDEIRSHLAAKGVSPEIIEQIMR